MTGLIPDIIEAFREQQTMIDELKSIIEAQNLKIKELEQKIEDADNKTAELKSAKTENESADITTNAFLYQNVPNPFDNNTEIKYFIPEEASNAVLYVFNLQGNLLKTEKIETTRQGSITISGSELQPGMYVYSLLVDGKEVDTKRMILTDN